MGAKKARKYDVFISYRRNGGEATAKMIKDSLEQRGYEVFFDVESLRAADFNTALYSVIENCQDFLLVLAPGSLDRASNENDWVRLELAHALKQKKNIIPVMLRGFAFPAALPEDIEAVRYKNGLEANTQFYDAFIDTLTTRFLQTKPGFWQRIVHNPVFKRTWPVLLALVILTGLATGGISLYHYFRGAYPSTKAEQNLTGEVLLTIEHHLTAADAMLEGVGKAYDACSNYLTLGDALSYQEANSTISVTYSQLQALPIEAYAVGDALSNSLNNSPFPKDDILAFHDYIETMRMDLLNELLTMRVMLAPDSGIDSITQMKLVKLKQQWASLYGYDIAYATNMLLLPVDIDYLKEFRNEMLPIYTHLPFDSVAWQSDEETLDGLLEASYNKASDVKDEMTVLVGDTNISAMANEAELIRYAMNLGFSQAEAEAQVAGLITQTESIAQLKVELEQIKLALDSARARIKTKFAPQDTDEPGILWGKMLRFLSVSMADEAIECAQAYQQKVRDSDEYADTYIPAVIAFIRQIGVTGIDYGLMVTGYEPDKPHHALYQIGDIVVAINGIPCPTVENYDAAFLKTGNTVTLLRPDENGNLALGSYDLPKDQARVLLYNLSEED